MVCAPQRLINEVASGSIDDASVRRGVQGEEPRQDAGEERRGESDGLSTRDV